MGLFDFIFGSKQPTIQNKVVLNSNGEYEVLMDYKLEELRNKNKLWEADFNYVISLRNTARNLEKENKLQEAIDNYLKSIRFGENCANLKINNYAFDIERVIILYGKTKQKELLKAFLEECINKYPDIRYSSDWSIRLSKLAVRRQ